MIEVHKMRLIIIFLSSSIIFCEANSEHLSKLFQLMKPDKEVADKQPIRVETTDSIIQCLLKLITLYSYFIEIEKTDSDKYLCKMFQGKIEDHATISSTRSNIYGPVLPLLCQYQRPSNKNGVYEISAVKNQPLKVYCDMENEGGGWTTIQRRVDGSVDFKRYWADYKKGYGDPAGNYWLGLDNIHAITNTFANVMLRIEASTFEGERAILISEGFKVDNEENLYKLTFGQVVQDPLSLARSWESTNGMSFSTRDRDNDVYRYSCSKMPGGYGGQWFKGCTGIYFNAEYPSYPGQESETGIIRIRTWKGNLCMKSILWRLKQRNK